MDFVALMGAESKVWAQPRMVVDLRSFRSHLQSFTEHYAIGAAVGRHPTHLRGIASVVPGDRLSRVSEKTAQSAGVNLKVFTVEGEAMSWLNADQP